MNGLRWLVGMFAFASLSGCGDPASSDSTYYAQSNSMAPTVHRDDEITLSRSSYRSVEDVKRWDLVVFRYGPRYHERGFVELDQVPQLYVKRVVGLPGETLTYSESDLLIDGEPLPVPAHLQFLGTLYSSRLPEFRGTEVVSIPADSLFLVGDNVDHSRDSRVFGPVDYGDVIGKVTQVNGEAFVQAAPVLGASSLNP